jgi:hypothetical protein
LSVCPAQIGELEEAVGEGKGFTVIVVEADWTHPFKLYVTVYVVVEAGETVID